MTTEVLPQLNKERSNALENRPPKYIPDMRHTAQWRRLQDLEFPIKPVIRFKASEAGGNTRLHHLPPRLTRHGVSQGVLAAQAPTGLLRSTNLDGIKAELGELTAAALEHLPNAMRPATLASSGAPRMYVGQTKINLVSKKHGYGKPCPRTPSLHSAEGHMPSIRVP